MVFKQRNSLKEYFKSESNGPRAVSLVNSSQVAKLYIRFGRSCIEHKEFHTVAIRQLSIHGNIETRFW